MNTDARTQLQTCAAQAHLCQVDMTFRISPMPVSPLLCCVADCVVDDGAFVAALSSFCSFILCGVSVWSVALLCGVLVVR